MLADLHGVQDTLEVAALQAAAAPAAIAEGKIQSLCKVLKRNQISESPNSLLRRVLPWAVMLPAGILTAPTNNEIQVGLTRHYTAAAAGGLCRMLCLLPWQFMNHSCCSVRHVSNRKLRFATLT